MIEIHLSTAEMLQAAMVGIMRRVQDLRAEREDKHGQPENVWDADIEGAMAEFAVAKHRRAFWSKGQINDPDVGFIQVRSTPHEDGGLILHDADADTAPYVLVRGRDGHYQLAGWCRGAEGKQQRFWETKKLPRPAYLVPAGLLHPIEKLGEPAPREAVAS